jgi:hypothetical protein
VSHTQSGEHTARLVALVAQPGEDLDAPLRAIVDAAWAAGLTLGGAVDVQERHAGRHRCDMVLRDLRTGRRISLAATTDQATRGCRLDHAALEDASGLAGAALDVGMDLLVIPRFGKREAAGAGFRAVIGRAVEAGIATLVGVNSTNLAAWRDFAGELAVECPLSHLDIPALLRTLTIVAPAPAPKHAAPQYLAVPAELG